MMEYEKLKNYMIRVTDLQYLSSLVSWESRVSGSFDSRDYLIDVVTRLEGELFELVTSLEYGDILNNLINSSEFNLFTECEQRYIENLYTKYNNYKKIPCEFYKEYVKNKQISTKMWEKAKKDNNYNLFKPYLKNNIEMAKKYYSYISDGNNLYDAMLNEYEKDITTEVLDKLFSELKDALIPLIQKVKSKEEKYEVDYDDYELKKAAKYILNYIGFDMNKGIVDIYPHGFTDKLNVNDVRITFNSTSSPISFVSTVIHEGGHGIFEQNISDKLSIFSNLCIDGGYALHESQSRFYENILGRNKNFWIPIYDDIKKLLKLDVSIDKFVELLNLVNVGPIRVDADELTYALHIIIRYEIERDLFNNKISIDDLPKIWNEKMEKYLGIIPKNDSEGLMQDLHWADGDFGYFPSYLVGNIFDGMFIEVIENKIGSIDEILKNGEIKKITNFLINNIYNYGGAYSGMEVIDRVCNKELSCKPIINYYNNKYNS